MAFSKCMSIVDQLSEADQDILLEKLATLQAAGLPPEQAQFKAIDDILSQMDRELADLGPDSQSAKQKPAKPRRDWTKAKVNVPVKIEDTGEVASLTMPVVQTLDEYDERTANIQRLLECL